MSMLKGPKYEQIINAAVRAIARHGYHQAQVSKIAKEAGVADGTIYLYFNNKEDILISLFRVKMGEFIEQIRTALMSVSTMEEKLKLLVEMHFKQLASDKDLAVVTQLELRQSNAELRQCMSGILKEYLDIIEELLLQGKEKQVFSLDLDEKLARQMIFGTLDEAAANWVMKDCAYDLTACAPPVYHMLLRGIAVKESR